MLCWVIITNRAPLIHSNKINSGLLTSSLIDNLVFCFVKGSLKIKFKNHI